MPSALKSPTAIDQGKLTLLAGSTALVVNVPSPLPSRIVTVLLLPFTDGQVGYAIAVKVSTLRLRYGSLPVAGDDAVSQLSAVFPWPNAAVPTTAFALLVSWNDMFPVGGSSPCAVTVAVKA